MRFFKLLSNSFYHAYRGLLLAFRTERSFRLQIAAALLILSALLILPLSRFERLVLLLATSAVLVLELLNSVIERLVDIIKPRLHEYVGDIKDLMAACVLVASVFAALVGLIILWPPFKEAIGRF